MRQIEFSVHEPGDRTDRPQRRARLEEAGVVVGTRSPNRPDRRAVRQRGRLAALLLRRLS